MGIHAEPPLPIAKILLARTYAYSESERRGLQKLRLLSDIKEHPLPPVTIFDDFILFHLQQVEKYIAIEAEHLLALYPPQSKERFQFLERNFFYERIIIEGAEFITAMTESKSQLQYFEGLQGQMSETGTLF